MHTQLALAAERQFRSALESQRCISLGEKYAKRRRGKKRNMLHDASIKRADTEDLFFCFRSLCRRAAASTLSGLHVYTQARSLAALRLCAVDRFRMSGLGRSQSRPCLCARCSESADTKDLNKYERLRRKVCEAQEAVSRLNDFMASGSILSLNSSRF